MKRILITGANSYIGTSLEKWMSMHCANQVEIKTLDMLNPDWEDFDFSNFDVVFHVAAIVHIKEKKDLWPLYQQVNTEMPILVAKKAKEASVHHFIFMSTKGVYAPNTPLITSDTIPAPVKMYGKSKLAAEKGLLGLSDNDFHVSILRPPTVFGEGCRGNFPKLYKFSQKYKFFVSLRNHRSMIYIWNLCEFIRLLIMEIPDVSKVYFPQNREYSGTLDILEAVWKNKGQHYHLVSCFNWILKIVMRIPIFGKLRTMFYDSVYDQSLSDDFQWKYCIYSFHEAIEKYIKAEIVK